MIESVVVRISAREASQQQHHHHHLAHRSAKNLLLLLLQFSVWCVFISRTFLLTPSTH